MLGGLKGTRFGLGAMDCMASFRFREISPQPYMGDVDSQEFKKASRFFLNRTISCSKLFFGLQMKDISCTSMQLKVDVINRQQFLLHNIGWS
eukprot:m.107584 g.107584  ORF g.107584 m.107584 type:complete len:92 (+) comp12692_c0_seq2:538-813(+)